MLCKPRWHNPFSHSAELQQLMDMSNAFPSCDVDADGLEDDPDESETDQADTEGAILADMMEETILDEGEAETDADQVDLVWELPVCLVDNQSTLF